MMEEKSFVTWRIQCHRNGFGPLKIPFWSIMQRLENRQWHNLNHLLDCTTSEPLCKSIFGSSLSILDLWSRPWVWPDCWVSAEFLRAPIPRKGSDSTTTTTMTQKRKVTFNPKYFTKVTYISSILKFLNTESLVVQVSNTTLNIKVYTSEPNRSSNS